MGDLHLDIIEIQELNWMLTPVYEEQLMLALVKRDNISIGSCLRTCLDTFHATWCSILSAQIH